MSGFVPPERINAARRAIAVGMAAASDLNDELTIIISASEEALAALEDGHPARAPLRMISAATQRCAWKTAGLLNYGVSRGVQPVMGARMERLILEAI